MNTPFEQKNDGMLKLKQTVKLPEVLDILIVGGGPGGTAAALRAKELGLSALVIDLDDIMRRIRDYAKGKPILPGFGGGDNMQFPKCGELVSLLNFSPIDKDEMFLQWKNYYYENSVPAQIGVEFIGLERQEDNVYAAKIWNSNTSSEHVILTKHIIIAIGRGFPRRFDIPGNSMDIAYRLADADDYIGEPCCVVGGGTSAAEAVIAISNAKVRANDATSVIWSYRGDKLPKVSKALADMFFSAYMGNGNIQYFPKSEPSAVILAEDNREYLTIRTERKFIKGKPNESAHLEFLKEFCVACIGEDIPEAFLNSLGIFMGIGGKGNKKRMVVNRFLQTQQENIYFVGDILSQAYFKTDDFSADPQTFKEIKHRGNIKAAINDGIYVVEVIAQRLKGKKDEEIQIEIAFYENGVTQNDDAKSTKVKEVLISSQVNITSEGPPKKSFTRERFTEEQTARLIRILPGNIEENEYSLKDDGITTIGRKNADINFPNDTLLSDIHASISHVPDGYFLRDDGSVNGIFWKAKAGEHIEVPSDSLVRLGKQFLFFQRKLDEVFFIHYDHNGKEINRYPVTEKTALLGRDAPDIVLDSSDMTLSRRHIAISLKNANIFLKDLKSVNGTWIKIKNLQKIEHGDIFRIGQQTFAFSLREEAFVDSNAFYSRSGIIPLKTPSKEKVSPESKAIVADSDLVITFQKAGKQCPFKRGMTVCDIAEGNGISINAECHAGICGSDPIKIISGKEHLNEMGAEEKDALEDICGLSTDDHRLACMALPKGVIAVEILEI